MSKKGQPSEKIKDKTFLLPGVVVYAFNLPALRRQRDLSVFGQPGLYRDSRLTKVTEWIETLSQKTRVEEVKIAINHDVSGI